MKLTTSRRVAAVLVAILVSSVAGRAAAQTAPVSLAPFEGLAGDLRSVSATASAPQKKADIAAALKEHTQELALYALGLSVYASLIEEGRLDKQVGTSAAGAGSTGLVSHGSVPALIGLAVESGALYQSVSGSVVTFRANPAGLVRALAKTSYWASRTPAQASALEQGISRLSASASFDFAQGASAGTFTGERSQLREAAVRYDALNKRDPRDPSHAGAIQTLRGDLGPMVQALTEYFTVLKKLPGFDPWCVATADTLVGVTTGDDTALKAALFAAGDEFTARFGSNPELRRLGASIVAGIRSYRASRDKVLESIGKSSTLTFEYSFDKLTLPEAALAALPAGTVVPDVSTFRVIFSSPLGTAGEATLNGSVTAFNSALPQMRGHLRDAQVAGSVDFRLPEIQGIGHPVLTFAGLGAVLHQQPFGVPVTLQNLATADGTIGVFQAKLTFPAGSALQIPVSFTLANRSEFNTEREVRGSIGVTFDLDKLFVR